MGHGTKKFDKTVLRLELSQSYGQSDDLQLGFLREASSELISSLSWSLDTISAESLNA